MHRVLAVLIALALLSGGCSNSDSDETSNVHCANSSVLNNRLDEVTRLIAASLTEDVAAELEASLDSMMAAAEQLEAEAPDDLAADAQYLRQVLTDYRDVFAEAQYNTRSVGINDPRIAGFSTDEYVQANARLYEQCPSPQADADQG